MRILHVVPTYLPATRYGGPIYSVHGLCKALVKQGHDIHVFTTSVDGPNDSDVLHGSAVELDGVKVWYFRSRWLRRLYWSPPLLAELKRQAEGFDVIHLHSVFLWPTWAAARVARACNVPYVLSPRGMLVNDLIRRKSRWIKSAWIALIERRNLENAAAIHVTSKREDTDLVSIRLALSRVEIIENGVDLSGQSEIMSLANADPVLEQAVARGAFALYLGRLSWKKGLDRLILAWKDVYQGHLLIAGNDDENLASRLREMIDALGLHERITLIDRRISGKEKSLLFANAVVTVLPSYSENFGNVVVEAMEMGSPVIVTEEVGAAEVILASGGGWVVDAPNLSRTINHAFRSPGEASDRGTAGQAFVETRLTWANIASRMLGLYAEISAVKQGASV